LPSDGKHDKCAIHLILIFLRLTAFNGNTHLQQYRRITNLVTFKHMTLLDESPGHLLPSLIILILKQDLTVYTLFILRVGGGKL